jgi:hypothetical protein
MNHASDEHEGNIILVWHFALSICNLHFVQYIKTVFQSA